MTGSHHRSAAPGREQAYEEGDILVDKYRLGRCIGRGAFGVVWIAENLALAGKVAIKMFAVNSKGGAGSERFLREARAMARLAHPAVVRVFDFGQTREGDPFIVMELLVGETLEAFLAREKRVEATRAVRILLPLAEALSVAHAAGIVHRDIKPANAFLTSDESGRMQPKLLDFGVAKQPEASTLTLDGTVIGTAQYMSPEQVEGTVADARSDVWAFCVVLHEMVSGRRPFDDPTPFNLMRAIVETEPSDPPGDGGIDDELVAILARGMQKAPADRWSTMRLLGQALARWLVDRGVDEDVCWASLYATWLVGTGRLSLPRSASRPEMDVPASPPKPKVASAPVASFRRSIGIFALGAAAALAVVVVVVALYRPMVPRTSNPDPVVDAAVASIGVPSPSTREVPPSASEPAPSIAVTAAKPPTSALPVRANPAPTPGTTSRAG